MSLLSSAVKNAEATKKERNTVVQVKGYEKSPTPNSNDILMVCTDLLTKEEVKIGLGAVQSVIATQGRITIDELQKHPTRSVEVGGYVRVDGLKLWKDGISLAKFVRPVKRSAEDNSRHFTIVKARLLKPKLHDRIDDAGNKSTFHTATIQIMHDNKAVAISSGAELKKTIHRMLIENQPKAAWIGSATVLLRGESVDSIRSFRGSRIKQPDGSYRDPNAEELKTQINEHALISDLGAALDAAQGEASIELIPGESQTVTGLVAQDQHYEQHSRIFYQGNFSMVNPETNVIAEAASTGFRSTIINYENKATANGSRWFVSSAAATLTDQLTLNGLPDAAAIRSTQSAKTMAQPSNQGAATQTMAAPANSFSDESPLAEESSQSLDDLLDSMDDTDDILARASEAFNSSDFSQSM